MKLIATAGHLIVQLTEVDGVAGCDDDDARPLFAKIVDVGADVQSDVPAEGTLWVDGLIVLRRWTGTRVSIQGVEYLIIHADDILATIDGDAETARTS